MKTFTTSARSSRHTVDSSITPPPGPAIAEFPGSVSRPAVRCPPPTATLNSAHESASALPTYPPGKPDVEAGNGQSAGCLRRELALVAGEVNVSALLLGLFSSSLVSPVSRYPLMPLASEIDDNGQLNSACSAPSTQRPDVPSKTQCLE